MSKELENVYDKVIESLKKSFKVCSEDGIPLSQEQEIMIVVEVILDQAGL
mgnify:CR=1 FL=1